MNLRKKIMNLKSTINKILLTIFGAFAVLLANSQPVDNSIVVDKIIAKIDEEIILMSDLDVAYLQAVNSGAGAQEGDLKCAVFESLIINKMLLARAVTDSVIVEDAFVDDELNRRMQYFIAQVGSEEQLEEYYKKPIDEIKSELRVQLKDQMTIQRMQDKISSDVKVSPGDVRKFFNDIPEDSLPFFSTEVEVGHIVVLPEVSKEQKSKTRKELEKIRQRIIDGEDFADLAREYSQDPGSGAGGGELGFFKKGDLVPEYEATALKLKAGETSKIVESQFGFHIIQLIEKRGSEYNSRHILMKAESSELDYGATEEFLDSLRTEILKGNVSFEKAAKEHSIDKNTTSTGGLLFDPETNSTRMPLEKLDPNLFFRIDTMKVGIISAPTMYTMGDKTGMRIIWYKSSTPPHQANLKDDYQKISIAALNDKKTKKLNDWFDRAKNTVYLDVDEEYSHCKILEE